MKAVDIAAGTCVGFQAGEKPVAICNVGGKYYVIQNLCPHKGALLSQGTVSANNITCPRHGWTFDITTGKNVGGAEGQIVSAEFDPDEIDFFLTGCKPIE